MSAPAVTSPKAKASKPKVAKKAPSHPTYSAMIRKSVSELKEKTGSSKAAILKYMLANYKLGDNVTKINAQLRLALKRGVVKGDLKQVKGSGASGSFKLGEKKAAAPKKVAAKKPASAKKPKSPKKAVAKKPKAEKKAKSPKKAKTPKAKSAAKKPKVAAKATKPKAVKPKASKPKAVKKVKA